MKTEKITRMVLVVLAILAMSGSAWATEGPIAHWEFDEGSGGTAYDSAGTNDGTINGAQWADGQIGGALDFDGVDDYVEVSDDNSLDLTSQATLSAWVNIRSTTTPQNIVGRWNWASSNQRCINLEARGDSNRKFRFNISTDGTDTTRTMLNSNQQFSADTWYHVAATYDGATMKVYINGQLDNSVAKTGNIFIGNTEWYIGAANYGSDMLFDGTIDGVQIYDRALSAAEIDRLYQEGSGLVAHWTFDEDSGGTAYDSAGNNDGTINGAQWTDGILSGALDFDGVDDYVNIPDSNVFDFGTGNFSMSAWFMANDTDGGFVIDLRQNDNDPHIEIYTFGYVANSLGTHILPGDDRIEGGSINVGQWHHAAITLDNGASGGYKLYLDGVLVGNRTCSALLSDWDTITIGALKSDGSYGFFNGLLDDVRIYDRVLSEVEVDGLYQDGLPIFTTYHVDDATGDNANSGLSRETAFKTIQAGIEEAADGDTVLVWPGVYNEVATFGLNFRGKAITVKSAEDAAGVAVLEVPNFIAVRFAQGEGEDSVLSNFVIRENFIGIFAFFSSPTVSNVTVVDNENGFISDLANPTITNSIFWNNTNGDLYECTAQYSYIQDEVEAGLVGHEVEINPIPGFVDAANGDYHLLSERGRYWPQHDVWVLDDVTSPCIDGGDPNTEPTEEPAPNGGRINIGAYGGTSYASMSESVLRGDTNFDGKVNLLDFAILTEDWLEDLPWAK